MQLRKPITIGLRRPVASGRAGFTLIEVTVSIGLIGITVAALAGGLVFGLKRSSYIQEELRATQIITEKFEVVRLYTWDQLKWSADYDTGDDLDDDEPFDSDDPHVVEDEPTPYILPDTFKAPFKPGATNSTDLVYNGTFNAEFVNDVSEAYSNSIIKITVGVNWTRNGKTQTRSSMTYFSRYGLQNNIPH